MSESSVRLPGTVRSKLGRAEMDEPCTRNSTGRGGSPACGRPARLRKRLSETSAFFAQYSELQIGPAAAGGPAAETGAAASKPRPKPPPLIREPPHPPSAPPPLTPTTSPPFLPPPAPH